MKKLFLFFICILFLFGLCQAQNSENQNNKSIAEYLDYLKHQDQLRIDRIDQFVKINNIPKSFYDENKNFVFIHHIDEQNKPIYYKSYSNVRLATSIRAKKIQPAGSMALSLNGAGMEVSAARSRLGMWEPGPTRTTHQDFGGRAVTRDLPVFILDSAGKGNEDHATHVAGTMMGSGVVDSARGMAFGAKLDCYEIQAGENVEMLTAGSEGMLVSNHSYGPEYDNTKTIQGMYDNGSQDMDSMLYLNPNYLPFFAVGNERNDAMAITYDVASGSGSLAKNTVTVGAVELLNTEYTSPADVIAMGFTNYGPADDSRIKPDFVAPGSEIFSATSNTDVSYGPKSGTSMATPGAAGSLFLLQQHFKNINAGKFMRAATLKAVAIHTCDESGAGDGPDAKFGWGLLNLENAVNVLNKKNNEHWYEEETLNNGASFFRDVTAKGGPFRVTICWTDLPGKPTAAGVKDDRTPKLTHDLDVRVIDNATGISITELPWKLDALNPANIATRGDNIVDNVEQIYAPNLTAGKSYKIKVTHKGTLLKASQAFSIAVSGLGAAVVSSIDHSNISTASIFPNPVTKNINIEVLQNYSKLNLEIISADGRIIMNNSYRNTSNMEIPFINEPTGIYYLKVTNDKGEIQVHKFTKN